MHNRLPLPLGTIKALLIIENKTDAKNIGLKNLIRNTIWCIGHYDYDDAIKYMESIKDDYPDFDLTKHKKAVLAAKKRYKAI